MASRIIAIGDIHGCAAALQTLVDAIDPQANDTIVALGDYVDRGPDSRGVIEQLIALRERCHLVTLIGNHEIMLLQALDSPAERNFWLKFGGRETLASYGEPQHSDDMDVIPDAHLKFINECERYYETPEFLFFHANYMPDIPPAEQPDGMIFWEHISVAPPGPHQSGKTVIVGHTPQLTGDVLDCGHVICIDTCCFGNGYLTAMNVESSEVWQADKLGRLRT